MDFHLFKPCDIHFDVEEQDADGFTITIHDATNRRGYEGYIRWWAIPENIPDDRFDEARRNAYATGLAQVRVPPDSVTGDGIAVVRFCRHRLPERAVTP